MLFSLFQGTIVYNIIGDLRAPFYFSVTTGANNNAVVRLDNSLIGDPFTQFTVSIMTN